MLYKVSLFRAKYLKVKNETKSPVQRSVSSDARKRMVDGLIRIANRRYISTGRKFYLQATLDVVWSYFFHESTNNIKYHVAKISSKSCHWQNIFLACRTKRRFKEFLLIHDLQISQLVFSFFVAASLKFTNESFCFTVFYDGYRPEKMSAKVTLRSYNLQPTIAVRYSFVSKVWNKIGNNLGLYIWMSVYIGNRICTEIIPRESIFFFK